MSYCEWCFGCVRLEAFLFVPFLIVVSSIVFVVWKAWQICYSVLKQFCHYLNACGPGVGLSSEKAVIGAASDTSRNYIVNPFRIYVTKLRKVIWLRAFCCFLVGCYCELNF